MSKEWKPYRARDPIDIIDYNDWVVTRHEWLIWSIDNHIRVTRVRLTPYHRHWTGPMDHLYSVDPNTNACMTCGAHTPEYIVGFLALADWSLDDVNT